MPGCVFPVLHTGVGIVGLDRGNRFWAGCGQTKKLFTGGIFVIYMKGGIPKNWEKPFCFYY
jgi:hypothetical protein